ncbi:trypsin-like peptidase domain-containing protein [Rhizobium laguerreae]|uniref:trypsin-like peptidase domain-containing protein n=1 Tax=Rhizobium laguerreae TaxID=1076926 RepID=UPI001C8FD105|nr:trypsin-like peptidase domain-containing protein [Rhizobium laguerreae]MBY3317295.1 hypothetical protein [Rhizobium laguerreae]
MLSRSVPRYLRDRCTLTTAQMRLVSVFALVLITSISWVARADPVVSVPRIKVLTLDSGRGNEFLAQGSGVLVSKTGIILTARHVIEAVAPGGGAGRIYRIDFGNPDNYSDAGLLGCSTQAVADVCALKIGDKAVADLGGLPLSMLCTSLNGDSIVAYGYPAGNDETLLVAPGRITGGPIGASMRTRSDIRIAPGMSGGAVLRDGYVVALNAGALNIEGTTYENVTYVQPLFRASELIRSVGLDCPSEPPPIAAGPIKVENEIIDVRYSDGDDGPWMIKGFLGPAVVVDGQVQQERCNGALSAPRAAAIYNYRDLTLALACSDSLQLKNLKTGEAAIFPIQHSGSSSWEYSNPIAVGQYIVADHGMKCLHVWKFDWHDVKKSSLKTRVECEAYVTGFDLAPRMGYFLAVGTDDGFFRIHELDDATKIIYEHHFKDVFTGQSQDNRIDDVQFAADFASGYRIAFHSWSNLGFVLDVPNLLTFNLRRFEYRVSTAVIFASSLSADGRWFAVGTSDGGVVVWNVETGAEKVAYFHDDRVYKVGFVGGDFVISTGEDGLVRIVRLSTGQEVDRLEIGGSLRALDTKYNSFLVGQGSFGKTGDPPFFAGKWNVTSSGKIKSPPAAR